LQAGIIIVGSKNTAAEFNTMKWFIAIFLILTLTEGAAGGTRTVYDELGRQVVVPTDPRRVVALAPSITEIVFALKQEHRLVGVTRFSDYPPAAKRLPTVGTYIYLDLEKIVSLRPDICIAVKDGNPESVVLRLEALGIPIYAVDPRNMDAVIETILEIGNLLHETERAENIANSLRQRIDAVIERVSKIDRRPKVFFQIGISPVVSVGTDTFIHELIDMAGGVNLTAGSVPYPRYSREQVLAMAPEYIMITSMARDAEFESIKAEWNRWPEIPAVKTNRIFIVDSDLFDRASPRLVDALEVLVDIIHPQTGEETR